MAECAETETLSPTVARAARIIIIVVVVVVGMEGTVGRPYW